MNVGFLRKYIKQEQFFIVAMLFSFFGCILYRYFLPTAGVSIQDYHIRSIVKGGWGVSSVHIGDSNILLGVIMKRLYMLNPDIDWWQYIQIVLIAFSFLIITYEVLKKVGYGIGIIIGLVINIILGMGVYHAIDYNRTAAILIFGGILTLLIDAEGKMWEKIIGSMFVFIGGLYSVKVCLIICVFALPLVIRRMINDINRKNEKIFFIVKRNLTIILPLFLVFLFSIFSKYMNLKDEAWDVWEEYYRMYNRIAEEEIPSWDIHKNDYEEIGLTENDVKVLTNGLLSDMRIFDESTLQSVIQIQQNDSDRDFKGFIWLLFNSLFYYTFGAIVIILLIAELELDYKNKRILIYSMAIYVLFSVILFFMYGETRLKNEWFVLCLGVIGNLLYLFVVMFSEKNVFILKRRQIIIGLMCLCVGFVEYNEHDLIDVYPEEREELKIYLNDLEMNYNNLYFLNGTYFEERLAKEDIEVGENLIVLSERAGNIPVQDTLFMQRGGKNYAELLVNDSSSYYITTNTEYAYMIETFLNEHYYSNISAENMGVDGFYYFFRFVNNEV